MNIIKYLIYLIIVFSVIKYYQDSKFDNNLILSIAVIIVIGNMITDWLLKSNENMANSSREKEKEERMNR
jgi:plastocyanin domain-containing protein